MFSVLQNLAEHICPLLLWCFWLAAVSIEGLPASMLHWAITEEDHSKECTATLIIFHRSGWFSHFRLFLNKDHLFAVRSRRSLQTSQAVQWYMFERLLSDRSSRGPNTAPSDQNSRTELWLGKQAAILMFFHSASLQQERIRSVILHH